MKHINHLSKNSPVKAESLLVVEQKVEIFSALIDALGALAETVEAWLGIVQGGEE